MFASTISLVFEVFSDPYDKFCDSQGKSVMTVNKKKMLADIQQPNIIDVTRARSAYKGCINVSRLSFRADDERRFAKKRMGIMPLL